jgi:prolyl-tRNA editing enzyme YbaK/EbsC (Cys-tRNA(Pro) deacylase)
MLDAVVRYLHDALVPFRLTSHPSPEPAPHTAIRIPEHGVLVDTKVVLVNGAPAVACYPAGSQIDAAALGRLLGGVVVDGSTADLPDELQHAGEPVPPLGQMFGMPLVVDERVADAAIVVFRAFGGDDFIEVDYDDFARLEQPRLGAFAFAGELGRGAEEAHPH